jgi:hypothetical protein
MADHTEFLTMAREMIKADGRLVAFAKLSATPSDAAKPWNGPAAPALTGSVNAYAVFLPDGSGFSKEIEDDALFKSSEQVLLVAPPESGQDLEGYHIITDGGVRWKVNVCKTLKPATLAVLYMMGVSR